MKLRDIFKNIDKSEGNRCVVAINDFSETLRYDFDDYREPPRIKSYWVAKRSSAGSCIGERVYFMDDEPIAFTTDFDEGATEYFSWVSLEEAIRVKEYLLSLISEKNNLDIYLLDLEEDIGDGFSLFFSSEVADWSRARYNGDAIEVLNSLDDKVYVKLVSGEEAILDMRDIVFNYNIN